MTDFICNSTTEQVGNPYTMTHGSKTKTGEKEWLEWRYFLTHEFNRRLENQYKQCDKDLAEAGLHSSCQRLTSE